MKSCVLTCILVISSLLPLTAQGKRSTERIDELNTQAAGFLGSYPDSTLILANEALDASKIISYHKGTAMALSRIAYGYYYKNLPDSAIKYFRSSLDFRRIHELSPSGIAAMYTWIGNTYGDKNMNEREISNLVEALKIRQSLDDQLLLADAHSDLAIAYKNYALKKLGVNDTLAAKEDIKLSISYLKSALKILEKAEQTERYADLCKTIATVYMVNAEYDYSLLYLNKADSIFTALYKKHNTDDSVMYLKELANISMRIGLVYNESGKAFQGTKFHQHALNINKQLADTFQLFFSFINMGDNALKLENYQKALENFKQAEAISDITKSDKRQILILYKNLATTYAELGNPEEANKYLTKRIHLNTEISLESGQARLEDATENIQLESKIEQIRIANDFQTRLNWWLICGGLLVTALLSIILYNSYQKQKYQKIIIENQEATHMQKLLSQLEEAEQQILSDQSAKQQMLLTAIGKELHDSIGSMLSAAKRELENLKNNLNDIPTKAAGQFDHSYSLVDKAIRDLRKISKSPDKLSLDEQLVPSLRELCKNINRIENSPQIILNTYRLEGVKLPAKHELHIFRIIQEAITNIIKHAQATEVHMQLDWADRILSITIEDNGKGFDPKTIQHGVGLDSMRSRTEELNGTFTLDTAPGKGSTLFMEISIPG